MTAKEILKKIQHIVLKHENIIAVYLFGSAAAGRLRCDSDIDLAVMSNRSIGGFERIELETEFSIAMGRDVDLVVFHQVEPLLQHQILKYGNLLFRKDERERVRQETRARREYLDTRFLFKELVASNG